MTSDSFIEVVQDAVDLTGMTEIPMDDRTRLLSDNGPGYVSRAFGDYLRLGWDQTHPGLAIPSARSRLTGPCQYGGNLGSSVLHRADTLIWLQLPWWVIFWRSFKRSICRARDRNLICGENVESWRHTVFSRESLLLWYIKLALGGGYNRSIARREQRIREAGGHATVVYLTPARLSTCAKTTWFCSSRNSDLIRT